MLLGSDMRSLVPACAVALREGARLSSNSVLIPIALCAPLFMGVEECTEATIGDQKVCEYGDKVYAPGDQFPSEDQCNTCTCSDTGDVACTLRACMPSDGCLYQGETYAHGAAVPSDDSCNTCGCFEGEVTCTNRACAPQYCEQQGVRYEINSTFTIGCSGCSCDERGVITCTPNVCSEDTQCKLGDSYFNVGASITCADGCNTCACVATDSGPALQTTLIGCSALPAIEICENRSTSTVTANPLYLDQNALALTLDFAGGCQPHAFRLCTDGVFRESAPAQLELWVEDTTFDLCSVATQQTRVFDLSPLRALYEASQGSNSGSIDLQLGVQTKLYAF